MRLEIVILAGGSSTRMGRDKSRLRLRGMTMLARVKKEALETGWPVRVVRRDLVGRCGPLGGMFTALKTTRADAVICVPCDMPLLTAGVLTGFAHFFEKARALAACCVVEDRRGFPMALRIEALNVVGAQIGSGEHSMQHMLDRLEASEWRPPGEQASNFFNVNTPEDLELARSALRSMPDMGGHPRSNDAGQS